MASSRLCGIGPAPGQRVRMLDTRRDRVPVARSGLPGSRFRARVSAWGRHAAISPARMYFRIRTASERTNPRTRADRDDTDVHFNYHMSHILCDTSVTGHRRPQQRNEPINTWYHKNRGIAHSQHTDTSTACFSAVTCYIVCKRSRAGRTVKFCVRELVCATKANTVS